MKAHAKTALSHVLRAMTLAVACVSALTLLVGSSTFGAWVAVGGVGCIALTFLVAWRAFAVDAAASARGALAALARAEVLKGTLALAGFVAVAITAPERFAPVLLGFGAALTGYWFALPLLARDGSSDRQRD